MSSSMACSGRGWLFEGEVQDCISLSSYAWGARYPGLDEPITAEEYAEAIRKAEVVVAWAEQVLES